MSADEGQFVKCEDHPSFVARSDDAKAVGQSGDDGFLVLEAAFGAFAAFNGKAGCGHLIAYGRGILQGEDQYQDIVLYEDVLA